MCHVTRLSQNRLLSVDIDLLEPPKGSRRPRFSADDLHMARLVGILEPVIAQPITDTQPPRYRILTSEASWYLAQAAQLHQVPVRVLEDLHDADVALIEDTRKRATQTASPLAKARIARQRITESRKNPRRRRTTVDEQAHQLGLSRTELSHLLRVLKLPRPIVERVDRGELSVGKARALVALKDRAAQLKLADEIQKKKMSTRKVEEAVRQEVAAATERKRNPAAQHRVEETAPAPADADQGPQPGAAKSPDIVRLEQTLGQQLGCPVDIDYRRDGSGSVRLDFFTLEDMDNVLEKLGYSGG